MARKPSQAAAPAEIPAAPDDATVAVHYVGDGESYVIGISTDPTVTSIVGLNAAAGAIDTGLYAEGPSPSAPAPEPEPDQAPEPDTAPADGAPEGAPE